MRAHRGSGASAGRRTTANRPGRTASRRAELQLPSTSARTRCDFSSCPRKWRRARRATVAISAIRGGRAAGSRGHERIAAQGRLRFAGEPERLAAPALGADEAGPRLVEEERVLRLQRAAAAGALRGAGKEAGELQDPDVEVGGVGQRRSSREEGVHGVPRQAVERLGRLRLGDERLEALGERRRGGAPRSRSFEREKDDRTGRRS